MGARLRYGKVIDSKLFYEKGARLHPGLPNKIIAHEDVGVTAAFLVLRGYSDDHGSASEQWRIEGPGGLVAYRSHPREIHLPTTTHTEHLEDEINDFEIAQADGNYSVVFTLDDEDVGRVRFEVFVTRS